MECNVVNLDSEKFDPQDYFQLFYRFRFPKILFSFFWERERGNLGKFPQTIASFQTAPVRDRVQSRKVEK